MIQEFFYKLKLTFFPCKKNKYRPKFLTSKFLFYYALFLLLLKIIVIPVFFYFPKTVFFASITKSNLVELTNVTREQLGLLPLKENHFLDQAAYLKARDMMEKDYFAHYSPEGISPWYWLKISGYDYRLAGENLAIGFFDSEQVHQAWMDSLSHKNNILNPSYREVGIAVLTGNFQGRETSMVVQYFGAEKIMASQEKPLEPELAETPPPETPAQVEKIVLDESFIEKEELDREQIEEEGVLVKDPFPFESKEVFALVRGEEIKKNPAFFLFQFMASSYYDLIQKVIYGSLILIILSLLATVYCDIFIYRKFEIQYKDAILKTIGFSFLWLVLVFLDKLIIIEMISQNFRINGI